MFAPASCLAQLGGIFACQACSCISRDIMKGARASFCYLFTMAITIAWIMRDYSRPLLEKIPAIAKHELKIDQWEEEYGDRWYGLQAVYRISFGNFAFFMLMAIGCIAVRYTSDIQAQIFHHGHWIFKGLLWLVFQVVPFFLPNSFVEGYGWVARICSGLFLVVQMIILLDFIQAWNDGWVEIAENEDDRYYYGLLILSFFSFTGALALVILMFHFFNPSIPSGSCDYNVAVITSAIIGCICVTTLAVFRPARGSLFTVSVVCLYSAYLMFSALKSEPPASAYECNGLSIDKPIKSTVTDLLTYFLTIGCVVYAAFRAGSNSSSFFADDEAGAELLPTSEPGSEVVGARNRDEKVRVQYNYSWFHVMFALASTYIAMMMTGWGFDANSKSFDVGWSSVYVKMASMWMVILLYVWYLIAPLLFPDRDFS